MTFQPNGNVVSLKKTLPQLENKAKVNLISLRSDEASRAR